jgi:hypothetical protein
LAKIFPTKPVQRAIIKEERNNILRIFLDLKNFILIFLFIRSVCAKLKIISAKIY